METDAGGDDNADEEWVETVAALFDGVGHPTRIAILEAVREGQPMAAVADERGVSRNTVQDHLNKVIAADLVYRPQQSDQHYSLTPFGQFFAVFLEEHGDAFAEIQERIAAAEAKAMSEFEDVPLDKRTRRNAVTSQKWDLASAEVLEMLEAEFPELTSDSDKTMEE